MIIAIVVLLALFAAPSVWLIMILSGALGHIFGAEALFISFWQAAVVYIALSVLSGILGSD